MDTNTPQSLSEAAAALCAAMEGQSFVAVSWPVTQAFLLAAGIAPVEAAPVEAAPAEAAPVEAAPVEAVPEVVTETVTAPAIELAGALTPEEEAHANNL